MNSRQIIFLKATKINSMRHEVTQQLLYVDGPNGRWTSTNIGSNFSVSFIASSQAKPQPNHHVGQSESFGCNDGNGVSGTL